MAAGYRLQQPLREVMPVLYWAEGSIYIPVLLCNPAAFLHHTLLLVCVGLSIAAFVILLGLRAYRRDALILSDDGIAFFAWMVRKPDQCGTRSRGSRGCYELRWENITAIEVAADRYAQCGEVRLRYRRDGLLTASDNAPFSPIISDAQDPPTRIFYGQEADMILCLHKLMGDPMVLHRTMLMLWQTKRQNMLS